METEVRFYYSSTSKDNIIKYLDTFKELEFQGRFYEITDQYNHPMKEYDFYSKDIDGRFRVRKTIGDSISKCMITWKKRLNSNELIHNEEEIEISINPEEYDNLCLILEKVLHLELVESYERYRSVYKNEDVEIVLDEYPFGLCIEIENKSSTKVAEEVIKDWLDKLNFNIKEAYNLSWDDKYEELCKEQNIMVEKIVRFDKEMPKVNKEFSKR
ncbi:MAG: CYTH domain-containing protein [Bacilli bacterium]|nr:CYTH domain-containing protein [Bacilli bacterium]MBQ7240981.1 CYTH domain-containing protein [Bacilli bacterium]